MNPIHQLQSTSPHHFFAFTSLLFGLILIFLTPPFQVPDEVNHFYRAYQIADGYPIGQNHENRLGGFVPASLVEVAEPFLHLRWQMNRKTSAAVIKGKLRTELNPGEKVFVDFPNTGLYNPVSYVPQSLAIFFLKAFNLPPLIILYGARIFTLFFWISSIAICIKFIPAYKWLFTFLALLPMSLYVNMSLSADVMSNILAFMFISFTLYSTQSKDLFGRKELLMFSAVTVLLVSAKIVYAPLVLLFLLIPKERFINTRHFFTYFFILGLAGLLTAFFWSSIIDSIYIPYAEYNPDHRDWIDLMRCANMDDQMNLIYKNFMYPVKVFGNSMVQTFDMYFYGYIGTFGWLDAKMPRWLVHLSYIVLIFVALFDVSARGILGFKHNAILLIALVISTFLLLLSQLLTWECVGSDVIKTIQGRYFIPIFPLLFLIINGIFRSPEPLQKMVKYVAVIFSTALLFLSCIVIYKRYYVYSSYEITTLTCDAEDVVSPHGLATTLPDVFLGNADKRTEERSRSGRYSLMLGSGSSFGFTHRYYGARYGDIIQVEVYRLGNSGSVVISGNAGKDFYVGSNEATETDEDGWERLSYSYTIEEDMGGKEIGIYVFNKSEPGYFDDFSVTILKKRTFMGF